MEEKIKEVMGLVIDVACTGIDYGKATETADGGGALKRLRDAEDAVEAKLRVLLESQPNLNCKSVQKRLAEQWGFVAP